MSRPVPPAQPSPVDAAPEVDARGRRRAREALLADRAAVARVRALRGLRVRPPSALPVLLGGDRRRLVLRTGLGDASED